AKGKSPQALAGSAGEPHTPARAQAAALGASAVPGRDTTAPPAPGRRPTAAAPSQKPPKPEERTTANAKPHRPGDESTSGGSMMNPIVRTEPMQRDNKPATTTRNRRPATPEEPQEPATAAHAPPEAA